MELIHLFLRGAYPESQGWTHSRNEEIDGIKLALVLQMERRYIIVPPVTTEPYVSKKNIERANYLKEQFQIENPDFKVQVLLFFEKLVMPPGKLPKNVLVFSIEEEASEETKKQYLLN